MNSGVSIQFAFGCTRRFPFGSTFVEPNGNLELNSGSIEPDSTGSTMIGDK